MAIVDRTISAQARAARCSTRHDTIEPTPAEGTHVRSVDRQDGHIAIGGARSLSQRLQRRIISVGCAHPAMLPRAL
jgi:hypothetical protein